MEGVAGVGDRVEDAARGKVRCVDVECDAWECGENGTVLLVCEKCGDEGEVFSSQSGERYRGVFGPCGAGEGCQEGPVE